MRGKAVLSPQSGPRPRKGPFKGPPPKPPLEKNSSTSRRKAPPDVAVFLALGLGPPLAFSSSMSLNLGPQASAGALCPTGWVPVAASQAPLAALAGRLLQPLELLP